MFYFISYELYIAEHLANELEGGLGQEWMNEIAQWRFLTQVTQGQFKKTNVTLAS